MAKRINRAVELLADGQPVYYVGGHTSLGQTFSTRPKGALTGMHTPVLTYEQGRFRTRFFRSGRPRQLSAWNGGRRTDPQWAPDARHYSRGAG